MILNPPSEPISQHEIKPSHYVPGEPTTTTLIPLGGSGEFGRNMTALICEGEFYLIDCGILFSAETYYGISGEFYDITPIVQRYGSPKAYFMTHAHRDHIGGLGYFLVHWPAPVYATPWTVEYIKADLYRIGLRHLASALNEVPVGTQFEVGCVRCEYISVNHSIPESQSLFIQTPHHRIAHSGDFKIDLKTSLEKPCDLSRWQEIASEGEIDVLMCDSTNAHYQGASPSEESTRTSLSEVIAAAGGRVFIATFSSNLWRLIHIIEAAKSHQRSVEVLGVGMQKSLAMAKSFGIYHHDQSSSYAPTTARQNSQMASQCTEGADDTAKVYIVSGSQMEPGSVLSRIVEGRYGDLKIQSGDTVVFSSRTIPGHEKALIKAVSQMRWLGAQVITIKDKEHIHVSGHGYVKDIDILESLIKPRYFIPVHGELSHLMSNALSRKSSAVFLWKNLQGCLLKKDQIHAVSFSDTFRQIYVDSSFKELPELALKYRRRAGLKGLLWVLGAYFKEESRFVCGPSFENTGLCVHPTKWEQVIERDLSQYLHKSIKTWLDRAHNQNQDDGCDSFIAARIETYLQQTYQLKTWVRSKVWLV